MYIFCILYCMRTRLRCRVFTTTSATVCTKHRNSRRRRKEHMVICSARLLSIPRVASRYTYVLNLSLRSTKKTHHILLVL